MSDTPDRQKRAAFFARHVLQIKRQVLLHVIFARPFSPNRPVPPLVLHDYASLTDYCEEDALGGLGEASTIAAGTPLFAREGAEDPKCWSQACETIRSAIDGWLFSGAMRQDAVFLADALVGEQIQALLDDARTQEATDMLEDLDARVGLAPWVLKRLRDLLPQDARLWLSGDWRPQSALQAGVWNLMPSQDCWQRHGKRMDAMHQRRRPKMDTTPSRYDCCSKCRCAPEPLLERRTV